LAAGRVRGKKLKKRGVARLEWKNVEGASPQFNSGNIQILRYPS